MKRSGFAALGLTLISILALGACRGDDDQSDAAGDPTNSATSVPVSAENGSKTSDSPLPGGALQSVASIVEKLTPSVVTVQTALFDTSSLGDPVPLGAGSGFIWDDDGHIVTNFHVVQETGSNQIVDEITVTFANGDSAEAEVIGFDVNTDIAVLRADLGEGSEPAEIGSVDELSVGDAVVAMGNALNLQGTPTVTSGIISALGRTINGVGSGGTGGIGIPDAIQTDAAINPGNSGGPLVNISGQVIGINDQVVRGTSAGIPVEGIGFAISIETARPVIEELIENGQVDRGFLGITLVDLVPEVVSRLDLDENRGVAITEVVSGSPADEAGLEEEDVIIQIGEIEIEDSGDLSTALLEYRAGDEVDITIIRDGDEETVDLTLGERPDA